ncbi:MCE family protein [Mycolicibacter algericus]|uniref:Virulence factor n=1 Tax=Mycolicibacter algericus TaxID=1288388 RepID=A0A7I9YAS5_MYCAL|nr:MCE family protein [Mycolicibacter algericus]GFG85612.1 virulence factor [Mycolicibacter algericus]
MIFVGLLGAFVALSTALFNKSFDSTVPVTLTSDRSGLVMETGSKVKLRGVQVGEVRSVLGGKGPVALRLAIDTDQMRYIPANVDAQIRVTSAFGAKFVDLIYPEHPAQSRLAAGAVLTSRNVTTEVNTVFENLTTLLRTVDPAKFNAILGALSQAFRGQGHTIGQAITDTNTVLGALNPRSETFRQDWQALKGFSDAYRSAAPDFVATLAALSTTSATLAAQADDLDSLLLNTIGLSGAGITLLAPNISSLSTAINTLAPSTELLRKYHPSYTCLLLGAKFFLDNGGYEAAGGDGRTLLMDSSLMLGQDPYRYPDNLPIVNAKGGPGGKPGCGSLPNVDEGFPVRQLITDTGWGTGMDIRPNPGIGFPGWSNYLPVTRGAPEPPSIRDFGGPAPGPIPYPDAPPYGASLYGPDGTPLYPDVPPPPIPPQPNSPTP